MVIAKVIASTHEASPLNVHTKFVPAARRVYEKVGFSLLSQKDEDYYYEGRWIP